MLVNFEPSANVTEVKLVILANAYAPILVTLSGMVIETKSVAPWNALVPIVFIPSGMVIEVKLITSWNTCSPMLVNLEPSSKVTEAKLFAP